MPTHFPRMADPNRPAAEAAQREVVSAERRAIRLAERDRSAALLSPRKVIERIEQGGWRRLSLRADGAIMLAGALPEDDVLLTALAREAEAIRACCTHVRRRASSSPRRRSPPRSEKRSVSCRCRKGPIGIARGRAPIAHARWDPAAGGAATRKINEIPAALPSFEESRIEAAGISRSSGRRSSGAFAAARGETSRRCRSAGSRAHDWPARS